MNREIKFRAWDGKEMHENVCINHEQKAIKYGYRATDWLKDSQAGIPMQYTGLKDSKGVDIYEGDIVKGLLNHYVNEPIGVVEFQGMAFCFIGKTKNGDDWIDTATNGYLKNHNGIEVIGNVYMNPELLNTK